MNKDQFKSAFGQTSASFEMAMRRAVAEHNQQKKRRIGPRGLLIAAVLTALLCGVAYAAVFGFDLLDLVRRGQPVLPGAETLVKNGIRQSGGELPDVIFTLEQIMSDGRQIFFTLKATPKDPDHVMLVDADLGNNTSIDLSVDHWKDIPEEEMRELTFDEAARSAGKKLVCPYLTRVYLGETTLSYNQPTLAYDGDSVVYVIAADYAATPGEPADLRLLVEQLDPLLGYDSHKEAELTAQVELTADAQNYAWDAPVNLPEIGVTVTQLYASATPTGITVYLSYRPADGADEVTLREVADWYPVLVDENGNRFGDVASVGWSSIQRTNDGGYMLTTTIPAMYPFTGVSILSGDSIVPFSVAETKSDPEGKSKPEDSADWMEGYDVIKPGGEYRHPSAEIAMGTSAEIPLLREYDTDYSGIIREMESLAASANLSVTADGYTLSVDQVAACDGYIWLSYTLTGEKPLDIFRDDPSIQGDYALKLSAPMFWGEVDGDLVVTDYTEQAFLADDHTLKGWKLFSCMGAPQTLPERFRLNLWTVAFLDRRYDSELNLMEDTPFGYSLAIDRSASATNTRTAKPGTKFTLGDREIEIISVSTSPLGGIMIIDETMPGDCSPSEFMLTDERGNNLPTEMYGGIPVSPGGKGRRTTMRYALSFAGGTQAESIRMVPLISKAETWGQLRPRVLMPIHQPLPYTAEFGDGLYLTVEDIHMDTNGMQIRYQCNLPNYYVSLTPLRDEEEDEGNALQSEITIDHVDRATGAWIKPYLWRAERGAAEGERIMTSTLDAIRYIGIQAFRLYPLWDQAIEIPIK